MAEILTRCGFRCDLCPAYEPNLTSFADRQRVSDGWLKYFAFRTRPEEVGCVGCLNGGRHAYESCPVRPCAMQRGLTNCAHCGEYACEKLKPILDFTEELMKKFAGMPEEDCELFIKPDEGKPRLTQIRLSLGK